MFSKEEGEQKARLIRRAKKYNCCDLLLGEYWERCSMNVGFIVCLIVILCVFFYLAVEVDLFAAIVVGFGFSVLLYCCYIYEYEMSRYPDFKDSDWYTKEEAQILLNGLEDQRPIYTQRVIVKNRTGDADNLDETVLDESEDVEYGDWLNLSSKVDFGGEDRKGITKMYISNSAEVGDIITHQTFEQKKQEFITLREGRGDYYRYSTNSDCPETPDFIFISRKTTDGKPIIPWYYNQKHTATFRKIGLEAFWEVFVESCLSTSVVFYNQKTISVTGIDEKLKQNFEQIREQNKFHL